MAFVFTNLFQSAFRSDFRANEPHDIDTQRGSAQSLNTFGEGSGSCFSQSPMHVTFTHCPGKVFGRCMSPKSLYITYPIFSCKVVGGGGSYNLAAARKKNICL